jgi:hypothetical protein
MPPNNHWSALKLQAFLTSPLHGELNAPQKETKNQAWAGIRFIQMGWSKYINKGRVMQPVACGDVQIQLTT